MKCWLQVAGWAVPIVAPVVLEPTKSDHQVMETEDPPVLRFRLGRTSVFAALRRDKTTRQTGAANNDEHDDEVGAWNRKGHKGTERNNFFALFCSCLNRGSRTPARPWKKML